MIFAPPSPTAPRIYRFALVAGPSAGKTCILASLSMPRLPHPHRYTCERLPIDFRADGKTAPGNEGTSPTGNRAKLSDEEKALLAGDDWITDAINRLNAGEMPPPNDASRKDQFRFRYTFTANNQSHCVELIDYSGELVRSGVAHVEPAQVLRRVLEGMDGLLVLAPLVKSTAEEDQLAEEVHDLQRAFAGLAEGIERAGEGPLNTPLAMLVNKWDRQGPLADAETAHEQLRAFLDGGPTPDGAKPPMHRGLADRMRNSVRAGDFEVFPVSAFGESVSVRRADGGEIERPRQINPLASFGLLDPFLWLVRQRNEIDLRLFLEKARKYRQVGWLPGPVSAGLTKSIDEGRKIARALPEGTLEQQRAKAVLGQLDSRRIGRSLVGVVLVFVTCLTAEWVWDIVGYKRTELTLSSPTSPQVAVDSSTDWYRSYLRTGPWRHLVLKATVLNPQKAEEKLKNYVDVQEQRAWNQVTEAGPHVLDQAPLASEFLRRFENSHQHKAEAKAIVTRARIAVEQRENEVTLQSLKTEFDTQSRRPSQGIDDLDRLKDMLSALPKYPTSETQTQAEDRRALMDAIVRKIGEVRDAAEWIKFEKTYETYMAGKEIITAARHLKGRLSDPRIGSLKTSFLSRSPDLLKQRIEALSIPKTDAAWDEARSLLDDFGRIDAALQNPDSAKYAEKLRGWINQQHDRYLYEQVRDRKDMERIRSYLSRAPLQSMRKVIEKYERYLDDSRGDKELDLTLFLVSVNWGPNADSDTNNEIMVRFGKAGHPATWAFDEKEVSSKGRQPQSFSNKKHDFRAKLTDRFSTSVEIIERDTIRTLDDSQGKGDDERFVRDMQSFCVTLYEGGNKNWVWFRVEGQPHEPVLPAWQP
jgi:hypothetical protein